MSPCANHRGFGFSSPATSEVSSSVVGFTVERDPRRGGVLPPYTMPPVLSVTHHAFVGAIVDDPLASAHRVAALLETPIVFEAPDAAPDAPVAAVSLVDCVLAFYALTDPDTAEAQWGRRHDRPGLCALGLRVDDLAVAGDALETVGVHPRTNTDASLFVDRSETGGIESHVLVDSLLPGDPRVTDQRSSSPGCRA